MLARLLQGIGGGAIPAIAYVAAGRAYPPELRPRVFAIMSTAWVLPGLIGPSISAAVTLQLGWRWVFFGLLPLIPLAAAMTLPSLRRLSAGADSATARCRPAAPRDRARARSRIAARLGRPAALTSRSSRPESGALLALRSYLALAPPGTLRLRPGLPVTIAMRAFQTFAFFGVDFFVPYAFHDVHGTSLTVAGLSVTAATFSWTAGAWVSERVLPRVGPRALVRHGLFWIVVGNVLIAVVLWPGTATLVAGLLGSVLAGLGMGLGYSVVSVTMLGYAEPGREGATASSLSLTDTLGAALATGLSGAFIALGAAHGWEPRTGVLLAYTLPTLTRCGGDLRRFATARRRCRRRTPPLPRPGALKLVTGY